MMASRIALQPTWSFPDGTLLFSAGCDRRTVFSILLPRNLCDLAGEGRKSARLRQESVFLNWRLRESLIRRRVLEIGMAVPRASLNFEYQVQRLAETGQTAVEFLLRGVSSVQSQISSSPSDATDNGILDKLSGTFNLAALAIIAGATVYVTAILSQKNSDASRGKNDSVVDQTAKDWSLIMKPTPFNRFVLMRCPAIAFKETDVYEGLAEKLTRDVRHSVSLENEDEKWAGTVLRGASRNDETTRFLARNLENDGKQNTRDTRPLFQRTCLHTEDGGVIAIDWPSHLELSGEHGLDTTFLLVPGSADGSGDKNVQNFVRRSLSSGHFPVVLNPRGCAGSPLTTPRLFTAGDSDDICTAVHFVNRTRPWATMMAVGWGYGANMLVKYLGEASAATPLTAAVCIGTHFDLGESTKSFRHGQGLSFDEQMKNGFVQILQSNQLIFEGRKKGFDVSKGLSARTVREFDATISMVANDFDTLEAFYKNSSSRSWIDKVKIPLLCIQGDECTARTFSIPHHVFEENSFTTLMLILSWGQDDPSFESVTGECWDSLIIEWLAAVELALLKGKHPLLQGIDVAIKPPKERPLLGSPKLIDRRDRDPSNENNIDGNFAANISRVRHHTMDLGSDLHTDKQPKERDKEVMAEGLQGIDNRGVAEISHARHHTMGLGSDLHTNKQPEEKDKKVMAEQLQDIDSTAVAQNPISRESDGSGVGDLKSSNASHEEENGEDPDEASESDAEIERGHVRQAAESVMKVLDVTMPGTLLKEQKQQVLDAVEKGETIVTALQEACPEEVRENMATAVSAAVQARGISLKLVGFGKNMPAPRIPEGMKEKIQEKLNSMVKTNFTTRSGDVSQSGVASGSKDPSMDKSSSPNEQSDLSVRSTEVKHHVQGIGDEKKPESSSSDAKEAAAVVPQADTTLTDGLSSRAQGQSQNTEMQQEKNVGNKIIEQHKEGGDTALAAEPVRFNSEISDELSSQGQLQTQNTETQQEKKTESKMTEHHKEGGAAEEIRDRASVDNKVNMEGKPIEIENQNNVLGNQDQKTDEESQKQETSGAVPRTKEPGSEVNGAEKKTEVATNSVSNQEDQNGKSIGTKLEEAFSQTPFPVPPIDMSGALQALTGVDDSTQMAVTNVFGVLENMIEELEKEHQKKGEHLDLPPHGKEHQVSTTEEHISEEPGKKKTNDGLQKGSSVCYLDEPWNGSSGIGPQHDLDTSSEAKMVIPTETTSNLGATSQKSTELLNSRELADRENGSKIMGTKIDTCDKQPGVRSTLGNLNDCNEVPLSLINTSQCENQNLKQTLVKNDQKSSRNITSGGPTLKLDPTSEIPNEDWDDVAMAYSNDENIWMHTSNNLSRKAPSKSYCDYNSNKEKFRVKQEIGEPEVLGSEELESSSKNSNNDPGKYQEFETTQVIEPSYVMLEDELKISEVQSGVDDIHEGRSEDTQLLTNGFVGKDMHNQGEGENERCLGNKVKELVSDALELELLRRLGHAGMESLGMELDKEIERVASAMAATLKLNVLRDHQEVSVVRETENHGGKLEDICSQEIDNKREGLHAEPIAYLIDSVYRETNIIARFIPAGILVGVVLAALSPLNLAISDNIQNDQKIRQIGQKESHDKEDLLQNQRFCEVDCQARSTQKGPLLLQDCDLPRSYSNDRVNGQESESDRDFSSGKMHLSSDNDSGKGSHGNDGSEEEEKSPVNNRMMDVAAVAMGATAIWGSQMATASITEQENRDKVSSEPTNVETNVLNGIPDSVEDNDNKAGLVSIIAERAVSIAAPVVPTNENGDVDHDRLVAILAGLGQKGGILRFIGKVALLWGGLRGAMSLTDRLLGFLRVSDRPLHQRLLGFLLMALLLWSPIIVPLFPALLQQWASKSSSGVAGKAAIMGLYGAIIILVTIWGRKIRGYDMPLSQYGLKLHSHSKAGQLYYLIGGLAMGLSLVASFYLLGISLGFIQFSWATNFYIDSSKTIAYNIVSSWRIMKLLVYSLGIGLAISVAEELLFRSWLHEEIEADLGFHRAAVLSGLVYALSRWSLPVVPGLWLLSLVLTGARVRCNGDLGLAIGFHTGLIAGNQIINLGGLVKHAANAPNWLTGAHTGNPLAGLFGVYVVGILALVSYPWDPISRQRDINVDVQQSSSAT